MRPRFRHASLAAAALAVSLAFTINSCGLQPAKPPVTTENMDHAIKDHADRLFSEGQQIFRFDTFGSEAFWTQTGLHRAIAGEKNGDVGPGVSPKQALGLKVDALKVPRKIHKGGYYHDGRFASLADVVNHYDRHFRIQLTEQEKADLIEFLKSI